METNKIYNENCKETIARIPDEFVNCVITSPPYFGLRDYGNPNQIGLEETLKQYVDNLVDIFRGIWRILKDDGTVWLNLGDSYAGSGKAQGQKPEHKNCGKIKQKRGYDVPNATPSKETGLKPKDLIGIPWRVAFALQQDGWYLKQDIIWHKPSSMPESVTDRCTKAHEYIFLLTKSQKYYYDNEAIKNPTKGTIHDKRARISRKRFPTEKINGIRKSGYYPMANKRSVWTINPKPFKEAHFAVFPEQLIQPCILAGCPEKGIVYDPFIGSGTTGAVAHKLNRYFLGSELNSEYVNIANKRLNPLLAQQKLF